MKRLLGILVLSCLCILLGLSVRWSKERRITLVTADENYWISREML